MTKREWKKKIYRGMAAELHQQVYDLGVEWLTLDADGELLSEVEERRMKAAADEIVEIFYRLGGPKTTSKGKVRFPDIS